MFFVKEKRECNVQNVVTQICRQQQRQVLLEKIFQQAKVVVERFCLVLLEFYVELVEKERELIQQLIGFAQIVERNLRRNYVSR